MGTFFCRNGASIYTFQLMIFIYLKLVIIRKGNLWFVAIVILGPYLCLRIFFFFCFRSHWDTCASMQDANRSLAGEMGCGRLKSLQRFVRLRQQFMVSQVQLLYPVKVATGQAPEQELESFTSIIKSGTDPAGSAPYFRGCFVFLNIVVAYIVDFIKHWNTINCHT